MKLNLPETNGGWKKYEGNPVLGSAELGTCIDVLVLKSEQGYDMHFSWRPKKSLAVCRSTDGVNWSDPEITGKAEPCEAGRELQPAVWAHPQRRQPHQL